MASQAPSHLTAVPADTDATVAAIPGMVRALRETFRSERTRPLEWRLRQLDGIARFVRENDDAIGKALQADLGKPRLEAFMSEIAFTLSELQLTRKKLPKWMKPRRVGTPIFVQPGSSRRMPEPYGVVLIIAPWNYPFNLLIGPLVGAVAAGNCVVLKPSEVSSNTSRLIAELLPRYVDGDCIQVVEGGVPETTALLAERFDYIFYTGNGQVGRIVMAAAAKHLTPVTLELGGKSPTIVDESADLDWTARRIVWAKFSNAGQTCVAPDYVLAHEAIHDRLLDKLAETVRSFYGDDPQKSPDYGRVINARHHKRLMALMGSGDVVVGGKADEADNYIAPTVLKNVAADSPVMGEEIFGPILPVLKVRSIDEAIDFVNDREKPLALYVYTKNQAVEDAVLSRTSSGGATINHGWLHLGVPELPFGGVGESGMGGYHGKHSFDTFTHFKSVLKKPFGLEPSLMYPPYDAKKQAWIKKFL